MITSVSIEVAKLFVKKTLSNRGLLALFFVYFILLSFAGYNGWKRYTSHHHTTHHHQEIARESWDNNPDKHPHRMAHYGNFVFRQQHPFSIFDTGIENYTGNAVFLEAHRQNTANFSEASLATGLVRIGELSIAMILQFILPLIIFFLGYNCISAEKENGILKLMHTQGASIGKIIAGKFLGLFTVSAIFFVPALIILWIVAVKESNEYALEMIPRAAFLTNGYLIYLSIIILITIIVSVSCENSTRALLILLGGWLLLGIIIPRSSQIIGNIVYPNLSKIAFKAAVENEVSKQGDSHNPDDPYFNSLRDSILQAYDVENVKDLPINYSGFIMYKGEEQTSRIYNEIHEELIESYRKQNGVSAKLALFNPYMAIKHISQSLSGTDFNTYVNFLDQIERYRYDQSQYLNDLQMQYISNSATSSEGKINVVSSQYWVDMPEFTYQFYPMIAVKKNECLIYLSLFAWLLIGVAILYRMDRSINIL